MRKRVGKALYVFLCSLLGVILFAIFHRSVALIYSILLSSDYDTYSFGLSDAALEALDFFTLLMTLFAGGWYGTALGLHWFRVVYDGHTNVGMFHAIIPHHWRKARPVVRSTPAPAPALKEKPAKIVHVQQSSAKRFDGIDSFESFKPSSPKTESWNFDDLETTILEKEKVIETVKEPVKPAVKKKSVRKSRLAAKSVKTDVFKPEPEVEDKPVRARKTVKAPTKRRTRTKTIVTTTETV